MSEESLSFANNWKVKAINQRTIFKFKQYISLFQKCIKKKAFPTILINLNKLKIDFKAK